MEKKKLSACMCCCLWVLRKLGKINFPARGTRCHDGPVENANLILGRGGPEMENNPQICECRLPRLVAKVER